jgi:hypothetical protein
VRKPGWLVPTSSEKLIYLPRPEAGTPQAKVDHRQHLPMRLPDIRLSALQVSALNPLASTPDRLPAGY